MKFDRSTVFTGVMNSSVVRSIAFLPLAYSLTRGPIALNSISRLPVSSTTDVTKESIAAGSSASSTGAWATPPPSLICFATNSMLAAARPCEKDFGALRREFLRDRRTYRAATAGHDGVLAIQQKVSGHRLLLS